MPEETKPETKDKGMGAEVIAGLVLTGIEFLLKEAPGIANSIRMLLSKNDPTAADFDAARAQIAKDSYAGIVTNSRLPKQG